MRLGLTEAEIRDTTPIEFDELNKQWLESIDQENARIGTVCAVLANLKRDPKKRSKAYNWNDFFTPLAEQSSGGVAVSAESEEMSAKQTARELDLLKVDLKTKKREQEAQEKRRTERRNARKRNS